jgi:hypothetical protein
MVKRFLTRGMNRLSPLIVRRVGAFAPALPLPDPRAGEAAPAPDWAEDLKLFATFWLGGLVFFGTYLA